MGTFGEWLKRHWWLVVFIVLVLLGFYGGIAFDYLTHKNKTFGEFLEFVLTSAIFPVSLAMLGFFLQSLQKSQEDARQELQREHDENKAKEDALESYFSSMTKLMNESNKEDYLIAIIRARTLSVLRRLSSKDGERKASIVQFLIEIIPLFKTDSIAKTIPLRLNLADADLSGANLTGVDLSGVNLSNANLTDVDLSDVKLSGADLTDANLTRANLLHADLTDANLTRANLLHAGLTAANLTRVNLRRADLDLRHADLRHVDLRHVDLSGLCLIGANLTDANLTNANLTDADLTDANLGHADLRHADLSGLCLIGVKFFGAKWPAPEEVAKARNIPPELRQYLGITDPQPPA